MKRTPLDKPPRELTPEALTCLHDYTVKLLATTGVAFHSTEALNIFKHHGMKTEGNVVRFRPEQISSALDSAPASVFVRARNRSHDLQIGGKGSIFAPGYGAPFVLAADGAMRLATMTDYRQFCQLVQTSSHISCNGYMMVQPSDLPVETAHLDMLLASMTLCDKVYMGSTGSAQTARDALAMARIVWPTLDFPVMIALISSLSPLQFSGEMADSLITFAEAGQPIIIMGGGMLGSTAPIDTPSFLVTQNAVVLAGLCLAQFIRPGTPVIYGVGGAPLDMKTGNYSIGAPEEPFLVCLGSQIAQHYQLPCRGGGALTDAVSADFQAGAESTATLVAAVAGGVDFILHACGILGTYIAMSYEKFLADEELCGYVSKMFKSIDFALESPDLEMIRQVGVGGEYLTRVETLKRCRTEFFQPTLAWRRNHDKWAAEGRLRLDQRASQNLKTRLEAYVQPDLDPGVEAALTAYVRSRKTDC